jgi:hypothetical protein
MQCIEKSDFYHSNLLTFSELSTLKDKLGGNSLVAHLRYANIGELIGVMP